LTVDCIYRFIVDHARVKPGEVAILAAGLPPLTYGALAAQIDRTVEVLRAAGLRRGDRVATVLPEGPETAVAILAVAAGATCVPLDPASSADDLKRSMAATRTRALLVERGGGGGGGDRPAVAAARSLGILVLELVPDNSAPAGVFSLAGGGQHGAGNEPAVRAGAECGDAAVILFTSGTTARPRVVPLSHRNISVSARDIAAAIGLTAGDRCLSAMPLFHIHGLSTLLATLVSGGSYVSQRGGFSAAEFFGCLREFRPTWYSASPTIHRVVLEHAERHPDLSHRYGLRLIRSASAALPRALAIGLERAFAAPVIEAYGMTEAAPQIASNRLPPFVRKPGSVGTAAGPDVAILDERGGLVPAGTTGGIAVRGANVTVGYENDPDANAAAFVGGWLRTGDLGHLDADGYLFVTGRSKEIINRGGEKVSPAAVEEVLLQHPAVAEAVAFPVPHRVLGENVAAAVVLDLRYANDGRNGASAADANALVQEIRAFAAARLAPFQVPQQVVVIDRFPTGPTGKLRRNDMARVLGLGGTNGQTDRPAAADVADARPRGAAERRVAEVFADVLNIELPGPRQGFFELGGHSLSAAQVVFRLRQIFDVDVPVARLFERPTPSALAELVGRLLADRLADGVAIPAPAGLRRISPAANEHPVERRVPQSGPVPLSLVQQGLYFLDRMGSGGAYNMSAALWLAGPLDTRVLAQALDEITRRHEPLRTTFAMAGEHPVQVVTPHKPTDLAAVDVTAVSECEREAEALRLATVEASRPFDLASGPVFRATLLRLAPEEHALLLTMHHLVSDGWSVGVLFGELHQLYASLLAGRASPLPELHVRYGDFAAWQRERLQGGALAGQIAYWREQLRDPPPSCGFPTDRRRPPVRSYRGATRRALLEPMLTERLRALGERVNATPFMVFLAAFQTFLFRYNDQHDSVVGAPVANRPRPEVEPLIGLFANTLVLRTSLAGDPSFAELLARVRATALGALEHPDVPVERLVEELRVPRDAGRTPLFQVMFAFQNLPGGQAADAFALADGLVARPFRADNPTAKFDLTLYLTPGDGGMAGTWQYNADLFEDATVERMVRHFRTLLEGIASDPSRRLSELPLLPEADRRQLQIEWNRTHTHWDDERSFVPSFEWQARRRPDAPAVIGDGGRLTYAELNARANQVGRYLRQIGAGPGTVVGVCLPRSAELLSVLLGVWKAGAAYLAIDPAYPTERIAFMLRDSGVSLVLTEPALLPALSRATESAAATGNNADASRAGPPELRVVCTETARGSIARESTANLDGAAADEDPAYVIYTSGSTGTPKGVVMTHRNVAHYVRAMARALGIAPDDRYLHTASFSFSSSVRQFAVPLSCGAAVVVASAQQARDPRALVDLARTEHVSIIDTIPSFWTECVRFLESLAPAERRTLPGERLRLVLLASEPMPSALPRDWARVTGATGARLVNMYGQTETTGIVTTYPLPAADNDDNACPTVPIGRPIANTRAYVLNASHQLVPVGVWGELYIGGAGVGRGYVNRPELTARHFLADPFTAAAGGGGGGGGRLYRTGDVARRRADGVLELAGRVDDQLKIHGFRVEPEEVEFALRGHPSVRECCVAAFADPHDGSASTSSSPAESASKRLVAFVARHDGASGGEGTSPEQLREFLKGRLPHYMLPHRIVAVGQLPRTAGGKVDRAALAATLDERWRAGGHPKLAGPTPAKLRIAPRGWLEQALADVWKDVLRLDTVGVDENFFDLGGSSLLSLNVVAAAHRAGVQLDLSQLYQHQTIAELARAVAAANGTPLNAGETTAAAAGDGSEFVLVTIASLRAYGREALARAGLDERGAEVVTEVQLEASLRGQPTHDMVSIPRYARRIAAGVINPRPLIRVERETATSALLDGDNGPGQWVATVAMDVAIAKARESGVGVVSVRRSNHFGAAGHYVWQAARAGLIGLCTTNGPLILAPTGGVTPTFGNNPLGVGIPAGRHAPILLDIAMSVAPRGRIGLHVAEGKPLPPGWILDQLGRPSTDLADLAAGLGVPIGGHKGYGLALVMEVLAGVLGGAGFCADHRRDKVRPPEQAPDFGHFFIVIDPALFTDPAEFTSRVDRLIDESKNGRRAEGTAEILIPGEAELRTRERSLRDGVRLRASTYRALVTYARDVGLDADLVVVDAAAATATAAAPATTA
jgi:amino acid adenylation domain-containing protein